MIKWLRRLFCFHRYEELKDHRGAYRCPKCDGLFLTNFVTGEIHYVCQYGELNDEQEKGAKHDSI